MIAKLLVAFLLMAGCVAIHAMGLLAILSSVQAQLKTGAKSFWSSTGRLIHIAGWTVLLHLLQIVAWAIFYAWREAMPDFATAAYFSAVTYTTTGYGDLVLPPEWRLVGGVEALTGILMCGLSVGMFVVLFSKLFNLDSAGKPPA